MNNQGYSNLLTVGKEYQILDSSTFNGAIFYQILADNDTKCWFKKLRFQ